MLFACNNKIVISDIFLWSMGIGLNAYQNHIYNVLSLLNCQISFCEDAYNKCFLSGKSWAYKPFVQKCQYDIWVKNISLMLNILYFCQYII